MGPTREASIKSRLHDLTKRRDALLRGDFNLSTIAQWSDLTREIDELLDQLLELRRAVL